VKQDDRCKDQLCQTGTTRPARACPHLLHTLCDEWRPFPLPGRHVGLTAVSGTGPVQRGPSHRRGYPPGFLSPHRYRQGGYSADGLHNSHRTKTNKMRETNPGTMNQVSGERVEVPQGSLLTALAR
jgi:hypothetical protein